MRNVPGIGIWFDTEPDYSRLFNTFEEADMYCKKYNGKVGDDVYLHPHLMNEGEISRMHEDDEFSSVF